MRLFRHVKNIFKKPEFKPPPPQVLFEVHKEISQSVSKAYQNKRIVQLYEHVSVKYLLDTAVQMYVGSRSCPRNMKVVKKLLEFAKNKSNKEQLLNVQFYQAYLEKLEALTEGDQQKFEHSSERLLELADLGHPIANVTQSLRQHLIGKQTYKVARNLLDKKKKKEKAELIKNSVQILTKAAQKGSYHSLYILGCLYEEGEINFKIDYTSAFNYFLLAASYDNPFAFFKLSQYYREGFGIPKNISLYLFYLKKAAELGICEAQHNLAVEYLNGNVITKNEIKAFSWFYHAGEHGFSHAKYNAAMILLQGTSCGKLKPNIKAALIKFEQVNKQGDINVQNLINKLIQLQKQQNWLQKIKTIKQTFK